MPKRVLIFDADGVLIEPWGFAKALETQHGIQRAQTREFFLGPFQQALVGNASLAQILPDYLTQWGWKHSLDEFVQLWLQSEDLPHIPLLARVTQLREQGEICCVASNQEPVRARYIEQQMTFSEKFDALFFSCDLGTLKPQHNFYRAVQKALGVEAEQIHFWDDSPQHVEGAIEAGWNAHLYQDQESVDAVI